MEGGGILYQIIGKTNKSWGWWWLVRKTDTAARINGVPVLVFFFERLELEGWRWNIFCPWWRGRWFSFFEHEVLPQKDGGERFVSFTLKHAFASSLCKFGFLWWCFIILISCQAMMHGFAMLHAHIANVWWLFLNRLAVQFQQITAGCLFSAKDELRERAHQAEVGLAAPVKI